MKNIREDIEEVIARTQAFYQMSSFGTALIKVKTISGLKESPALNLTDYQFPNDTQRYLDDCAQRQLNHWRQRLALPDDQIPALGPWYGMAEHSSFLGGEVKYSADTSWQEPVLSNPSQLERLSLDEDNETYQMVIGGIAYLRERYGDLFAPMVRGTSGVLEIANALRGSDFFYDFYEDENALIKLLDYLERAVIWYYGRQVDTAGDFCGGTMTGFGEWLPGRAIGQLSEDTTAMLSLDLFERFGRPHTERICASFDAAFMHTHALSERCLASISNIRGIKVMEISSDPNTDRAIAVFRRVRSQLGPVVPLLRLTREEILENMDLLKEQKTIIWYDALSMEDAVDMCALVRRELPVL